ncbi:MAG: sigma factor-like helix-turn-helix DNA-binding protein, partial [Verrucomicrobiota bacterium]
VSFESYAALESDEESPQLTSHSIAPGTSSDISAILSILKPEERELMYLKHHDGYSASEIARLTGKPRGTILSSLHRSEQKLQSRIAPNSENRKKEA